MTKILIHDDGGKCQGTPLDANGRCPACGLTPDMQSVALVEPSVIDAITTTDHTITFTCCGCSKQAVVPVEGDPRTSCNWSTPAGWTYIMEILPAGNLTTEEIYCTRQCMREHECGGMQ